MMPRNIIHTLVVNLADIGNIVKVFIISCNLGSPSINSQPSHHIARVSLLNTNVDHLGKKLISKQQKLDFERNSNSNWTKE